MERVKSAAAQGVQALSQGWLWVPLVPCSLGVPAALCPSAQAVTSPMLSPAPQVKSIQAFPLPQAWLQEPPGLGTLAWTCPSGPAVPRTRDTDGTEPSQQLAGDQSQLQGSGRAKQAPAQLQGSALLRVTKTEGQASPKPCHSALWGLQQEKCAAALPGSRRFTQQGKKQLEIKRVIVL